MICLFYLTISQTQKKQEMFRAVQFSTLSTLKWQNSNLLQSLYDLERVPIVPEELGLVDVRMDSAVAEVNDIRKSIYLS